MPPRQINDSFCLSCPPLLFDFLQPPSQNSVLPVSNNLFFLFQHARIVAKLERAEINPKKRLPPGNDGGMAATSTDVFKINLVYKDAKGSEHEPRWLIKVTRSDVNGVADNLLRHEKTVYSRSGTLTQSNSVAFLLSVGALFGTTKTSKFSTHN